MTPDDPKSWIGTASAILASGLAGLFTWSAKRKIDHWDNKLDEQDKRIGALESNRVTHDDISELRQSIMASVVHSGDRIESQLRDVQRLLLGKSLP